MVASATNPHPPVAPAAHTSAPPLPPVTARAGRSFAPSQDQFVRTIVAPAQAVVGTAKGLLAALKPQVRRGFQILRDNPKQTGAALFGIAVGIGLAAIPGVPAVMGAAFVLAGLGFAGYQVFLMVRARMVAQANRVTAPSQAGSQAPSLTDGDFTDAQSDFGSYAAAASRTASVAGSDAADIQADRVTNSAATDALAGGVTSSTAAEHQADRVTSSAAAVLGSAAAGEAATRGASFSLMDADVYDPSTAAAAERGRRAGAAELAMAQQDKVS